MSPWTAPLPAAIALWGVVFVVRAAVGAVGEPDALAWLALAAAGEAAVLAWAARASRLTGGRLLGALLLAHYGIGTLLTAAEASYLALLRPLVGSLLVGGAASSVVIVTTATLLRGGIVGRGARPSPPARTLVWRLPLLGTIWSALFVAAGALVFLPLAERLAPTALEAYGALELPVWVLPFQLARGAAWAALALPLARSLRGGALRRGALLGALFAVLVGWGLLLPNEALPAGLRAAHLVEVALENALFGLAVAALLPPAARRGVRG